MYIFVIYRSLVLRKKKTRSLLWLTSITLLSVNLLHQTALHTSGPATDTRATSRTIAIGVTGILSHFQSSSKNYPTHNKGR